MLWKRAVLVAGAALLGLGFSAPAFSADVDFTRDGHVTSDPWT